MTEEIRKLLLDFKKTIRQATDLIELLKLEMRIDRILAKHPRKP